MDVISFSAGLATGLTAGLMASGLGKSAGKEEPKPYISLTDGFTGCEVCWTWSWAPCEEGTHNSFPDNRGGWEVCQMCLAAEENRKLRKELKEIMGI